jgi:hypothetical protein
MAALDVSNPFFELVAEEMAIGSYAEERTHSLGERAQVPQVRFHTQPQQTESAGGDNRYGVLPPMRVVRPG